MKTLLYKTLLCVLLSNVSINELLDIEMNLKILKTYETVIDIDGLGYPTSFEFCIDSIHIKNELINQQIEYKDFIEYIQLKINQQ